MIPSVLAQHVRRGVEDFLRTTFPVTTPFFHGMLDQLLAEDGGVFKGPYLSVQLPFLQGTGGSNFFPDVPLSFPPYLHQERAFERLSGTAPKPTIVATGTGSGKTECFLYPILDHCRRHRDEPGIKAILIYPMNALATDQAGRIAKIIWENDKLKNKVTAGLFVGQSDSSPKKVMTEDSVITDKDTQRLKPPDILLTNYKMLDYLLVRPKDQPLWAHNGPETLQFLVVDELHTFDGAQGTDLACLIRRLKARLKTPESFLCGVGTSATLGSKDGGGELRKYAQVVFDESFDDQSVVTESRQGAGDFLLDAMISRLDLVPHTKAELLDPDNYDDYQAYVRAQYEVWLGQSLSAEEFATGEWRVALGEDLKGHLLFQNLLKALGGRTCSYVEVLSRLEKVTPEFQKAPPGYCGHLLGSLICLISEARVKTQRADGTWTTSPFLNVRLQLWLRELRRMVGEVSTKPRLRFADDLNETQLKSHMPVIHCRECGSMGWAGVKRRHGSLVDSDLKSFYVSYFGNSPQVTFLFPEDIDVLPQGMLAMPSLICTECLHLTPQTEDDTCGHCDSHEVIRVLVPENRVKRKNRFVGTHNCPFCGGSDSLTILGSRAASLTSVLVAQLFSSSFNDDKKLLTFSDSVQDAAHRAGFFSARTYRFNLRAAIQQFVLAEGDGLTLAELPAAFCSHWANAFGEPNAFIATFLAPDMAWFSDYEELQREGKLPDDSQLLEDVERRIGWEILSEYGFRARIGRTLEKTSSSVAHTDAMLLGRVVERLADQLRNEIGPLREMTELDLRRFLVGIVVHLKDEGGIIHPALDGHIERRGNIWLINRIPWMPNFGPHTRVPVFIMNTSGGWFDLLLSRSPTHCTWHQAWTEKCFGQLHPLVAAETDRIFAFVLKCLVDEGLFEERGNDKDKVWGLIPSALRVSQNVAQLRCRDCGHNASVAEAERAIWEEAPCLRFHCDGKYERQEPRVDYYGKLYAKGDVQRVFTAEHTGLLERQDREELERQFKAEATERQPWYPNLLSCTPTLELGINIGDLSSLVLCSVPPGQANYLQRIGRAGRRDGNALNLAVANARPHDLYFFSEPHEMISGHVESPGIFLAASAVLERQFTAFCFDRWMETGVPVSAVPTKRGALGQILNNLDKADEKKFPFNLLHFIEANRTKIFDHFLAVFDLASESPEATHLRRFVEGDEKHEGSLGYRVLDGLHGLNKERKSLNNKITLLRERIKKKENETAKDKNHADDLADLKREKAALQSLAVALTSKDVFNFLTDEGLLPNYAFPEAGIVLKSVIFRRKAKLKDGDKGKYDTWSYTYERPAQSAIAELAPANYFFAGGRRVQVDQVDMGVSEVETWRLCRECSYTELVGVKEAQSTCPRCGDAMWSDEGQKRHMLRMRQVYASTSDRLSRIVDDSDDREPNFYNKQMLVDFEHKHVTKAYKVDSEDLPFGFEFLSRATFREINFGEKKDQGPDVVVAGVDLPRKGFTLCRHCGKIQDDKGEIRHALTCTARNQESADNLTDCVYLYREFVSEAIRMLLPVTTFAGSERKLHSFVAALHLGLKKRFRGNVDHLQTAVYDEPVPNSAYRRRYLVLYDTVPGGTGYLKQLMLSQDELMEVFQQALAVLTSCECNRDSGRDGCYRCLFAYRHSYDMKETSRNAAVELFSEVLKHRQKLIAAKSLQEIPVNALFDSVLEAMFIEALRRARSKTLSVSVTKDVVGGKPGYFLKIGEQAYYVELQVSVGPSEGVAVLSKVDFVLHRARSSAGSKKIAVFTDGFGPHKGRVGLDTAQRMALLRSGGFHVWSLTWKDVENIFTPQGSYFHDYVDPTDTLGAVKFGNFADHYGAKPLQEANGETSFHWFIRFLANPDVELWQRYAFIHSLTRLDPTGFATSAALEKWRALMTECMGAMDSGLGEIGGDGLRGLLERHGQGHDRTFRCFVAAEKASISPMDADGIRLGCWLCDTAEIREHKNFEAIWNGYLRLLNLFQFLPASVFTTAEGLAKNEYDILDSVVSGLPAPHSIGTTPDGWSEILGLTDQDIHPLLNSLAEHGWPPPEIPPFELTNDGEETVAEAELGWPEFRIAVLRDEELDGREHFNTAGWKTLELKIALDTPDTLLELRKG